MPTYDPFGDSPWVSPNARANIALGHARRKQNKATGFASVPENFSGDPSSLQPKGGQASGAETDTERRLRLGQTFDPAAVEQTEALSRYERAGGMRAEEARARANPAVAEAYRKRGEIERQRAFADLPQEVADLGPETLPSAEEALGAAIRQRPDGGYDVHYADGRYATMDEGQLKQAYHTARLEQFRSADAVLLGIRAMAPQMPRVAPKPTKFEPVPGLPGAFYDPENPDTIHTVEVPPQAIENAKRVAGAKGARRTYIQQRMGDNWMEFRVDPETGQVVDEGRVVSTAAPSAQISLRTMTENVQQPDGTFKSQAVARAVIVTPSEKRGGEPTIQVTEGVVVGTPVETGGWITTKEKSPEGKMIYWQENPSLGQRYQLQGIPQGAQDADVWEAKTFRVGKLPLAKDVHAYQRRLPTGRWEVMVPDTPEGRELADELQKVGAAVDVKVGNGAPVQPPAEPAASAAAPVSHIPDEYLDGQTIGVLTAYGRKLKAAADAGDADARARLERVRAVVITKLQADQGSKSP